MIIQNHQEIFIVKFLRKYVYLKMNLSKSSIDSYVNKLIYLKTNYITQKII